MTHAKHPPLKFWYQNDTTGLKRLVVTDIDPSENYLAYRIKAFLSIWRKIVTQCLIHALELGSCTWATMRSFGTSHRSALKTRFTWSRRARNNLLALRMMMHVCPFIERAADHLEFNYHARLWAAAVHATRHIYLAKHDCRLQDGWESTRTGGQAGKHNYALQKYHLLYWWEKKRTPQK